MDRETLLELLDYQDWAWTEVGKAIAAQEADLTKPAPGSGWPAVRDCLAHMCFGYDVWTLRLDGGPPTVFDPRAAASFAELDAYRSKVVGRLRVCLANLTDEALQTDRDVQTHGGEVLRYTPAEIMAHAVVHERAHHGDLSTLFYQLGLEMPMVDYRFYVDAKR